MIVQILAKDKFNLALTCLVIAGIVVTTIVVNAVLVPSYWLDELYSATLIHQPFEQMWQTIVADVHPPLYFLLLRIWASIGSDSEIYLRTLSALFLVCAVLWALLMRKGLDRLAFSLFLLLIFSNHMFLYYSQEVRSYTFLFFLSIILTFLVYYFDAATSRLEPIFVVGTLLALTHYFGILLAVVTYLVLAFECRHQIGKLTLVALFLALACIWPVYHLFFGPLMTQNMEKIAWLTVDGPLHTLTIAACAAISAACVAKKFLLPPHLIGQVLALVAALALFIWALSSTRRLGGFTGVSRLILIVVLFVSAIMVIDLSVSISTNRNYIVILPPLYLSVSILLAKTLNSDTKLAKTTLVLFLLFILSQFAHQGRQLYKKAGNYENYARMTERALASARDDTPIFYYAILHPEFGTHSEWEGEVYNFYTSKMSGGRRKALPLRLEQAKSMQRPFVVMFCHVEESAHDRLLMELGETSPISQEYFHNRAFNGRLCGYLDVQG